MSIIDSSMNPSIGSSDLDSLSQTDSLEEDARAANGTTTRISLDGVQTGSAISLERIQTGSGISLDCMRAESGISFDGTQAGSGVSLDEQIVQTGSEISLEGVLKASEKKLCILSNSVEQVDSGSNPYLSSEEDGHSNGVNNRSGGKINAMHHSLERVRKGSRKQARFSFDNGEVFHTTSVTDLQKRKSTSASSNSIHSQPLRRSRSVTGTEYSETRACRPPGRKPSVRMPRRHTVAVNEVAGPRLDSLPRSSPPPLCAGATPKDNITSRRRRELAHSSHQRNICEHHHHEECDSGDEYLTPLQRKDKVIRELKEEIKRHTAVLEDKEREAQSLERQRARDIQAAVDDKDKEIVKLTKELDLLKKSFESLTTSHSEAVRSVESLEETVRDLKEEITKRDDEQQDLFYRMFKKGQQTALFQRQEDIENLAREDPLNVTVDELLDKLHNTESKLEWWQTIRTEESYNKGGNCRPQSEAEAKLNFLRDALFHYVTARRGDQAQHLKAMLGLMEFTESQKKKLDQVMCERKRFSNTAASIKKKLSSLKPSTSS